MRSTTGHRQAMVHVQGGSSVVTLTGQLSESHAQGKHSRQIWRLVWPWTTDAWYAATPACLCVVHALCRRMTGICKLNASQRHANWPLPPADHAEGLHTLAKQAGLAAQGKLERMAPRRERTLTCQSTTNTTSAAMMPVPTASTFTVTILHQQTLDKTSCQSQSAPIFRAELAEMLASVCSAALLPAQAVA